jgi:hypothetical protein
MRGACDVTVFGEGQSLPLTMEAWEALSQEGLCMYRLTVLAAAKGLPVVLTLEQSAHTLAIGMTMVVNGGKAPNPAQVKGLKWALLLKARKLGAMHLQVAATTYLAEFAAEAASEQPEKPDSPGAAEGAPNP